MHGKIATRRAEDRAKIERAFGDWVYLLHELTQEQWLMNGPDHPVIRIGDDEWGRGDPARREHPNGKSR